MKLKELLPVLAVMWLAATAVHAQTETLLHVFTNSPDGANPVGGLVLAGGTFYGATRNGGSAGDGAVFAMNADGTGYRVLHNFTNDPDGAQPSSALVLAGDTLYGATAMGGTNNFGTLFALNTNGDSAGYAVLYNFNVYSNGVLPSGRLTLTGDTLYGSALGEGYGNPGWGTIFSINTNGSNYTALYNFSTPHGSPLTNDDGEQPASGVVLSGGTLYGTAYGGGTNGYGTVYSVQTNGADFTVLHAFTNNLDGAYAQGGLTLAGTTLFGTTEIGGTNGNGIVYAINTDGTGYHVLHDFDTNGMDGLRPFVGMTFRGNTLYGTTRSGGSSGHGTVFAINTNGSSYTVLYAFATNTPDGANPESELLISGNTLYGTTEAGGGAGAGTVFALTLPLAITSFNLAGSNAVINAADGLSGDTCTVLMSTNPATSLSQWLPVASSSLTNTGGFSITATNAVNTGLGQQFYILQEQ